jgi:hypothetical protein
MKPALTVLVKNLSQIARITEKSVKSAQSVTVSILRVALPVPVADDDQNPAFHSSSH